jgi:hypothetical protein
MRTVFQRLGFLAGIGILAAAGLRGADPADGQAAGAVSWKGVLQPDNPRPFGIEKRVP